jgi:hypothetical protein
MNIHQAIYMNILKLNEKVDKMALDFTKLTADVTAERNTIDSAITLLTAINTELKDLHIKLADALAANDPAALAAAQAQIDALVVNVEANTGVLAAAVQSNT